MDAPSPTAGFRPPPGLGNRHVQTLLPRALPRVALKVDREVLELPDGDFVELAWARPAPSRPTPPSWCSSTG